MKQKTKENISSFISGFITIGGLLGIVLALVFMYVGYASIWLVVAAGIFLIVAIIGNMLI